jgi:DNA-binding transcriptional MocR family regulator
VELWCDDAVAIAVERAKREYARRRLALLAALAERGVPARGRSGINVWVHIDGSAADEAAAVTALRDKGWAVAPGSLYRLASSAGLRITVSSLDPSDVDRLADAVADALATPHEPAATWAALGR